MIRIILISFSLIFSQSLDVTFKYVESPNDDFVRVFVPGTMPEGSSNDWGPNSNGFINPDAPSQMLYNETSDSYEKTYNLQIGNQYLYKLHFHHNNSGTNYSWVSDPFNSEIKIFKDKFFVVDFKNTLRCFYLKDGTECWNIKTEDSFTVSNSKFSMLIKDNLVIYNNSLGDITAVDILSGLIQWQLPTQTSSIMNETYGFNFSKLVSDGSSIYFSNNKNQFYSVDLKSGTMNWMSEINSILTPIIIGNFIFTVSENGYLFTIQKNEGNIIRINDIYKNFNLKKRKRIKPTGFTIGGNNLYLTNSDGNLIVISLSAGNVIKIEKVGRDLISKPLIYDENLFIVKNGSITQYD